MINPTLRALRQSGGTGSNDAIRNEVVRIMELSEAQVQATFRRQAKDVRRIDNRLDWVKVYLGTTGFIKRLACGKWALTQEGMQQQVVDPQKIISRARAIHQR